MESKTVNLFETGYFTIAESARLTRVPAQRISRWVRIQDDHVKGGRRRPKPVWQTATPPIDGTATLGFNDLLEVRFVHELRKLKIPLRTIRRAVAELANILGGQHPFSQETVFALGRDLIAQLKDADGKPIFIELSGSKQTLFYETTLPDLKKGLVFRKGIAARWYPDEDNFNRVIINPRVMFGTPVIEGTRLSTDFLSSAFQAEGSYEKVAYWYGIETADVIQAVEFHHQYRAA